MVPLICKGLAPPIEMENVQVLALAGASALVAGHDIAVVVPQQATLASAAAWGSGTASTRGTVMPWDFSGSYEAGFAWRSSVPLQAVAWVDAFFGRGPSATAMLS